MPQQHSPRHTNVILQTAPAGGGARTTSPSNERSAACEDAYNIASAHASPRYENTFPFVNYTPRGGPHSPTPGIGAAGGGAGQPFGMHSHPGSFYRLAAAAPLQHQRLSIAFTKSDENACSHCFGADTIIKSVRNAGSFFSTFVADEDDDDGHRTGSHHDEGGVGGDDGDGHRSRFQGPGDGLMVDVDIVREACPHCGTFAVTPSGTRSYHSQSPTANVGASTPSGSNGGLVPPPPLAAGSSWQQQQQQPRPPPHRPLAPRGLNVESSDTPTTSPLDSPGAGATSMPHHYRGGSHRLPAIVPDLPGGTSHVHRDLHDCVSAATSNPTSLSDPPSLSIQDIRLGTPSSVTMTVVGSTGPMTGHGGINNNNNNDNSVSRSICNALENSFALSWSQGGAVGGASATTAEAMRRSLRRSSRERLIAFSMSLFEQFQALRNVVENRLVDPCTCGSVAMQEVVPDESPAMRPAPAPQLQLHSATASCNTSPPPNALRTSQSPRRPQDATLQLPPLAGSHSPRKTSIDTVMSVAMDTAGSTATSSPNMPNHAVPPLPPFSNGNSNPQQQQQQLTPHQRPVVTIVPRQRQRSQVAFSLVDDVGGTAGTPQETPRNGHHPTTTPQQQQAQGMPLVPDRRDSATSHASSTTDPSPRDGQELISFEPLPPDPMDEHGAGARAPLKARKSLIMSTTVAQETDDVSGFEMVNQYLMMEEIGSGASGVVFAVCNTETNKDFAMKVIKRNRFQQRRSSLAGTIHSGGAQIATNREVAIMKKLRHPHIVRLHEVIDDPTHNKLYLVMQLLTGGRLCPSLDMATGACEPVPADRLRRFVYQMCDGLRYLHQHNIIHRDVKPENMMLDADGNVVLVDFGVSEVAADEEGTVEGAIGTPAFMAPEVWDGDKVCGAAADVWSLGVSVFMMLVGRSPFPVTTRTELIEQVRTRRPDFPPDMAPEWRSLLKGTLAKDPATRISLSAIMRNKMFAEFRPVDMSTSQRPSALRGAIVVTEDDVQSAIAGRSDFQVVFCDDAAGVSSGGPQASLIGQLEPDSEGPSPLSSTNVYNFGGGAPPSGFSLGMAGASIPGAGFSAPVGFCSTGAGFSGTGGFSLPGAGMSGFSGPPGVSMGFMPSAVDPREPSLGERSGSTRSAATQQVLPLPPVVVCVSEEKLMRARSRRVVRSGGSGGSGSSRVPPKN